jgi:hypothetical protein
MGQGPLLEIYRHKETNLPQKFQIVYRRKSYKIKKEEIKEIAYNISNPKDRRIQFIAIKLKPLSPVFNCMMVDKFTDSHQPQDDIHSNAQIGANILCVMNHNLVYKILSKETDFYTLKIDEWISCSDFSQVADDVYFRYTQVLNQNWISLSKAERVYSVSILSKKPRKNSLTSSSSSRSSSLSSSLSSSNTVSSPNVLLDRNVVCDEEKDVQHQGAMKVEAAEEVDEGQEEQPETLALSQLLQEISEDDLTTVKNAWNYGKASLVEVVSLPCGVLGSPVPILGKNMQRMEKGWLEDVIINGYMWLLHKRDQKLCAANPDRKPCHFFPSFFMAKLFENDEVSHSLVERWGQRVEGGNIFKMRKVFIPVNIPGGLENKGMHWCLCVADIEKMTIQYFDSLPYDGEKYTRAVKDYFAGEVNDTPSPIPDAVLSNCGPIPCLYMFLCFLL